MRRWASSLVLACALYARVGLAGADVEVDGAHGALPAEGSSPAEGSLFAEGSLQAEGSRPAEGSLPAERSACSAEVAEATARIVQARYDGIRDLRAEFEQVSQSASFAGEPLMDSDPKRGRVVFAKPGKMRWTYEAPDPSVVVSNGEILWIHDVAAETATRLEVTEGYLSGAALQFLLGDGQILEEFEVKATDCAAERVTLDLTPKVDAGYERLGLVANATSGDIVGTSIVDLFGNRTEIGFRQVEVNQDPAATVFEFVAPDGIEVIEYAADPTSQTD